MHENMIRLVTLNITMLNGKMMELIRDDD